jgi:alkane 1-monooxygenase
MVGRECRAAVVQIDTPGGATVPSMEHSKGELARIVAPHLMAFAFPGYALFFLLTGPHQGGRALLYVLPLLLHATADLFSPPVRRQPELDVPSWPFDGLLYALVALQLVNIALLVRLFAVQSFWSLDTLAATVVVGANTGYSAIVVAHELVHRRSWGQQQLGRLLMCTAMYEHFYTEHLRGHHARVGTPDDPATARFGENYNVFWRRTVPALFRSAWRLETKRLGDVDMSLFDARNLHNRVLHGLLIEWSAAFAVLAFFGLAAFAAFLLQAFVAVRLLEAVNYFEHWGLQRRTRRVQPVDSWDTHSWFTYYSLTGLSRHADHHAWPARPFQQLRVWDEAPLLPYGYIGMVDMVMGRNAEFQEQASQELARRRLGPFASEQAPDAESVPRPIGPREAHERLEQAQAHYDVEKPSGPIRRALGALPSPARQVLLGSALLIGVTLGVQWEATGETSFGSQLLQTAWIAAVFATSLVALRQLQERLGNESLAWGLALGLVLTMGVLTHIVV